MVTLGLAALAGLLFGLSPAWMSFKVNLSEVLKGRGSMGADRRFVSRALVVAEIFFSVIFLGGGSVLVESFLALRNSDPGFDMENLLTVTLVLPEGEAEQIALAERLIARAESVPGVLDATLVSSLPQNIYLNTESFSVDEQPLGPDDPSPRAVLLITSPEYLDTLSFPVLRGRFFSPIDLQDTGDVTVVSQSFAERYWPGQDAVGRRITVREVSREIIGVVGNTQQSLVNQGESSQGAVYLPFAQQPMSAPFLLVRTRMEPEALAGAMRNELAAADSRVSIGRIESLQAFVDQFFVGANFFNTILTGFGALALLLAALGTYGVLAYNVAQRSQEFGIRMAMGAGPSTIIRMVTRQGVKLGVIGLILGAPGIFALDLAANVLHVVMELVHRDGVSHPSYTDCIAAVARQGPWVQRKRHPELDLRIEELEVAGKDTDDRVGDTVQDETFTGRVASSFVVFLPKAVIEDNDGGGAFETFLDVERAAAKKLGAEDLEKTGGDLGCHDGLGALAGAEAHRCRAKAGEVHE